MLPIVVSYILCIHLYYYSYIDEFISILETYRIYIFNVYDGGKEKKGGGKNTTQSSSTRLLRIVRKLSLSCYEI